MLKAFQEGATALSTHLQQRREMFVTTSQLACVDLRQDERLCYEDLPIPTHVMEMITAMGGTVKGHTWGDVINQLRGSGREESRRRRINGALYWLRRNGWLTYTKVTSSTGDIERTFTVVA